MMVISVMKGFNGRLNIDGNIWQLVHDNINLEQFEWNNNYKDDSWLDRKITIAHEHHLQFFPHW